MIQVFSVDMKYLAAMATFVNPRLLALCLCLALLLAPFGAVADDTPQGIEIGPVGIGLEGRYKSEFKISHYTIQDAAGSDKLTEKLDVNNEYTIKVTVYRTDGINDLRSVTIFAWHNYTYWKDYGINGPTDSVKASDWHPNTVMKLRCDVTPMASIHSPSNGVVIIQPNDFVSISISHQDQDVMYCSFSMQYPTTGEVEFNENGSYANPPPGILKDERVSNMTASPLNKLLDGSENYATFAFKFTPRDQVRFCWWWFKIVVCDVKGKIVVAEPGNRSSWTGCSVSDKPPLYGYYRYTNMAVSSSPASGESGDAYGAAAPGNSTTTNSVALDYSSNWNYSVSANLTGDLMKGADRITGSNITAVSSLPNNRICNGDSKSGGGYDNRTQNFANGGSNLTLTYQTWPDGDVNERGAIRYSVFIPQGTPWGTYEQNVVYTIRQDDFNPYPVDQYGNYRPPYS